MKKILFILMIGFLSACSTTGDTKICSWCEGTIFWHQNGHVMMTMQYKEENGKPYHPWCIKMKQELEKKVTK